jgi:ribonuclease HII
VIPPTLEFERELFAAGATALAGIDEVGRGALAGPVSVGVVVIQPSVGEIPAGLTDSKLLKASAREALIPLIHEWCLASAVGHASAQEIDEVGIIAALRRACIRALSTLPIAPDVVILDGSHDWLTKADDLFAEADPVATPPVHMRIKADLTCASVSAASIAAKVERDALMRALDAASRIRTVGSQGLRQ